MELEQVESYVARRSALIYLPISLSVAILFFIAASLSGELPLVAIIGGTVWVGLLSLIVAMPVITSEVKKRMK